MLDVARPEKRKGKQLYVQVRWLGGPDEGNPWQDSCVPVQWLADPRWVASARAMEALRYEEQEEVRELPAKAARRSARLAQLTVPDGGATGEQKHSDDVKLALVLGAHLLGQIDVGVPRTDGLAVRLGSVQMGEMDDAIVQNMWEDWGLCNALDECLACRQTWVPKGPMHVWMMRAHARLPRGT